MGEDNYPRYTWRDWLRYRLANFVCRGGPVIASWMTVAACAKYLLT